jgi:hypothetical protein
MPAGCNNVLWYWMMYVGLNTLPVRGMNLMQVNEDKQLLGQFLEFSSVAWGIDTGTCWPITPCLSCEKALPLINPLQQDTPAKLLAVHRFHSSRERERNGGIHGFVNTMGLAGRVALVWSKRVSIGRWHFSLAYTVGAASRMRTFQCATRNNGEDILFSSNGCLPTALNGT